jgi:hypothetical protein
MRNEHPCGKPQDIFGEIPSKPRFIGAKKNRLVAAVLTVIFFLLPVTLAHKAVYAEDRTLWTLDGKPVLLEEAVLAPKAVLFIWQAACPRCTHELRKISETCVDFGARVFYVNVSDSPDDIQELINDLKLKDCVTKNILVDRDGFTLNGLGFYVEFPTILFFKDGKNIKTSMGYELDEEILKEVYGKSK